MKAETEIQAEIRHLMEQGYDEIEDEFTLLIEYAEDGMGGEADMAKRIGWMRRWDGQDSATAM